MKITIYLQRRLIAEIASWSYRVPIYAWEWKGSGYEDAIAAVRAARNRLRKAIAAFGITSTRVEVIE